ncbi:unnamed protein product [Adineta steineri]|uniref:Uncharacterized protein n=1 Tax=Adineta steineri TaxID=433720 RepID=A0A814Z0I6_9BILA|nr:unnamed protein product [Adineta steineri]CAF3703253.1 unnamed protein product [Adineta steineri]
MWESANTTATNTIDYNSQISFYEYPPQKPFINSIYQPLRSSSNSLSKTVALPESNRDQLLTTLQALSLRIKTLENEREKAELNLHQITNDIHQPRIHHKHVQNTSDKQMKKGNQDLYSSQDQYNKKTLQITNEDRPRKIRTGRKKKRSYQENDNFDIGNCEGRHFHVDINTVPFILGASTTPSHNVKSNLQNVIALLKNHNHHLCLSSKEYSELLHSNVKNDFSPHNDHYNKSSRTRSSSVSPVRSKSTSIRRSHSTVRRPQSSINSDRQCCSRIKSLRQEFEILAREHASLNTSRANSRELEIINRRMEMILDELERLQRQIKSSLRKSSSFRDQIESEKIETPLETLRKTRLLQIILKDPTNRQLCRERSHRRRSNIND